MSVRQYSLTQKFTPERYNSIIRSYDRSLQSKLDDSFQVTKVIGHLSLKQRCVPDVQIIDSAGKPLGGTSHTCNTQGSIQSSKWERLTVECNMGEGCTRNSPPPGEGWFLHVDGGRHTMEWHGGQTSHRRRREGFWPLWEAEVQRPADVSRRVYVRRRRR